MVWACSWRPSRSRGPEWDKWQDRLKLGTDYPSALVATITWDSGEGQVTSLNVWDSAEAVGDFYMPG